MFPNHNIIYLLTIDGWKNYPNVIGKILFFSLQQNEGIMPMCRQITETYNVIFYFFFIWSANHVKYPSSWLSRNTIEFQTRDVNMRLSTQFFFLLTKYNRYYSHNNNNLPWTKDRCVYVHISTTNIL